MTATFEEQLTETREMNQEIADYFAGIEKRRQEHMEHKCTTFRTIDDHIAECTDCKAIYSSSGITFKIADEFQRDFRGRNAWPELYNSLQAILSLVTDLQSALGVKNLARIDTEEVEKARVLISRIDQKNGDPAESA